MNVKDLLEAKKIPYVAKGRDYVVQCTNPEHDDSNPSMHIDQILGIYRCFSCGHKGNIFYDHNEAPDKLQAKRETLKRKIQKMRSQSIGLEFPEDYTPYVGSWRNIAPETYRRFEAFKSTQSEFQSRIVFPIRDITGRIVVFQGRDELGTAKSKYINWPGGIRMPLFPVVEPIRGSVVLVEGIFDAINLHDKGLDNAMCIFGVNNVNETDLINLRLQGVSEVVGMLDADDAGKRGSESLAALCEKVGIRYKEQTLPKGKDPGDLNKIQVDIIKEQLYG